MDDESEELQAMEARRNLNRRILLADGLSPLVEALLSNSIVKIESILCEEYQATFSSENDSVKKCREIINICLEKKIDVNIKSTNYCALLHFVIKQLDEDFESVINKCEAFDVNAVSCKSQKSLLHLAIEEKKQNVVKVLLEFGANVDVKDNHKQTPLFYAALFKQAEIAEMLLKAGANVNAKDDENMMPINYAFGEKIDSHSCEKYKPSKLVVLLCSYGADLNFKNESGTKTLLMVSRKGHFSEIEFLVEHGADLFSSVEGGRTALHSAVSGHNYNLVDFLLRSGFDINAKNLGDLSPIHLLANNVEDFFHPILYFKNLIFKCTVDMWNLDFKCEDMEAADMIEFLADNGAHINILYRNKFTPLMRSVRRNALEITECLLELSDSIYINSFVSYYECCPVGCNQYTELQFDRNTTWVLLTAFFALHDMDISILFLSDGFEWVESFYEKCKEEVIKMQERRICADRELSFFDFLNEDLMIVTKFFRNCDVMSALESDKYEEFPAYKYMFEKRIERVRKIKNCRNVFIRSLKDFFKRNLPIVVIDRIINYLTAGDLRNFGRAFCIMGKID